MKLAFFEGDEMLGIGWTDYPISHHYLCPTCGQIWGREIVLDPERSTVEHVHQCWHVHCPEHPQPWRSDPLFSTQSRPDWQRVTIPREVLVRDFIVIDRLAEESCQS